MYDFNIYTNLYVMCPDKKKLYVRSMGVFPVVNILFIEDEILPFKDIYP